MIKLYILGSSSGVPTKTRYPTSIALNVDGDVYLFDCGEPCSSLLVRKGISYNKTKSIFVSHMDPDHSSGIFMLIQLMQLTKRKTPLKLFLPQEAIDGFTKYARTVYLPSELLRFELEILPIGPNGPTYQNEHLRLSAYSNSHLKGRLGQLYPHSRLESYSFLVEANSKRIVYSGDIGSPQDLAPLLTQEIHLLISELAHFEPEELFGFLLEKNVKKIILTHIHPDLDDQEDKLVELGNSYFGANRVYVAYDGLEMEIQR